MSDDELGSWQKKLLAAVVIAVLGGNAGFLLNKVSPDARNDPFTGAEGREMEHRLDTIDAIQQTMTWRMNLREVEAEKCKEALENHLRLHP